MSFSKNSLAFFSLLLFTLGLQPDAMARQAEYVNHAFSYSFAYRDDAARSVIEDQPPSPIHGMRIEYTDHEAIDVSAQYIARYTIAGLSEELQELQAKTAGCTSVNIDGFFGEYYACEGEFVAYRRVTTNDSDILFEAMYQAPTKADYLENYISILKSFRITTSQDGINN